jgi:hypothetical protein
MVAGVHTILRFVKRKVQSIWSELKGLWNGQGGSGYRGSIIQESSIWHDNWPSMKQIFRVLFRKRIGLLTQQDGSNHVIVYGATSHMG